MSSCIVSQICVKEAEFLVEFNKPKLYFDEIFEMGGEVFKSFPFQIGPAAPHLSLHKWFYRIREGGISNWPSMAGVGAPTQQLFNVAETTNNTFVNGILTARNSDIPQLTNPMRFDFFMRCQL